MSATEQKEWMVQLIYAYSYEKKKNGLNEHQRTTIVP